MNEITAEACILCVRPSGEKVPTTLRIGRPRQVDSNEAACSVSLPGLHGKPYEIRGTDTLHALVLALSFAWILLSDFLRRGGRILSDDGSCEIPLNVLLPFPTSTDPSDRA